MSFKWRHDEMSTLLRNIVYLTANTLNWALLKFIGKDDKFELLECFYNNWFDRITQNQADFIENPSVNI